MSTNISTLARAIAREYNRNAHRGGRLQVWGDGSTRWMTTGSRVTNQGDPVYLGSITLDSRERMTQRAAQEWIDQRGLAEMAFINAKLPDNGESHDDHE